MDQRGRDVGQRHDDERPRRQARVRDPQRQAVVPGRLVDPPVVVEQDVDVDHPRPEPDRVVRWPAEGPFEGLERAEKVPRRQAGPGPHDLVEKRRLRGVAHGIRLVDRRHRLDDGQARQAAAGRRQRGRPVAEVAAEAEVNRVPAAQRRIRCHPNGR